MRKIHGLQYLRAVAAIGVAAYHAAGRGGRAFHLGEMGVDLFFVLSGFLMIVVTGPATRASAFLADRLRRIVPLYWIATTVMVAGALAGAFPNLRLAPLHTLASYLFVPWRSPLGANWPVLVPGWTLNLEMAFYVAFAALLALGSQRRQVAALTLLFAGAVTLGALAGARGAIAVTYTDPILLEFAGGCWLGLAWKRAAAWPRVLGWGTAAVALLLALPFAGGAPVPRALGYGVPAMLLLTSVLAVERRTAIARRRLPLFLGDASYSIYLFHGLGISVATAVAHRFGFAPEATIALAFTAGLAVGAAAYVVVERPILAFFRERKYVRGVPVPAGP